ncbi:MAG TPA: S41 family peptidase [Puia sp.]|nr:S41 family peptidase [Puia sp.]
MTKKNRTQPGVFQSLLLCLLLSGVLTGCRKSMDVERITSYSGQSYSEVFESFWKGMDENYMFWDIETVDWNNMYKTYKPRFEYLDQQKGDPTTGLKAVQYLVDMTKDLSDSHLNLTFNGQATYLIEGYPITSTTFNPASIRHQLRGDRGPIPRTVFDQVIPQHYLTKAEFGTDINDAFEINLGIIPRGGKNILYIEFSEFMLSQEYWAENSTATPVKPVLDDFFRYTKDPSIDGLIIDLRGNPGGSVPDLDFFLGALITTPMQMSYTRTKNGDGALDYTPWIKGYVHPQPGSTDFTGKPVAVLVDGNSVSMSEMTSMTAKAIFPKAKLVGEQTWGGTGQIPPSDVRYLGGQFTAANFVQVYMAGAEMRDINMVCHENKGFTPDIPVAYDTTAIKSNIDVMLDKAIQHVVTTN